MNEIGHHHHHCGFFSFFNEVMQTHFVPYTIRDCKIYEKPEMKYKVEIHGCHYWL